MFHPRATMVVLPMLLAASLALARPPVPAAISCAPLPGTYVVDPAGGGDFTDLQTALDAVPADSTVVVKGRNWGGPIFIRRAMTIVGLHMSGIWSDSPPPPREYAIEIDAGTDARVTFYGLDLELAPADKRNGTNGILVHSAGDMVISDSTITCSFVPTSFGDVYQRDGDALAAGATKSLFIIRSTIKGGGDGVLVLGCSGNKMSGTHGGDGVQGGDVVVVVDSDVKGGDGGAIILDCDDCNGLEAYPGTPGNGIAGGKVYLSNTSVAGGAPGSAWLEWCEPWPGTRSDPGADVLGTRVDLPDALHGNDAVMGQPLHVKGDGYAPGELVLLFFSKSIGPAIPLKQGPWLLEWPFVLVGIVPTDDAGSFALDGTVPKDPQIEGKSFVVQAFAASRVSEPIVYVPWQNHN